MSFKEFIKERDMARPFFEITLSSKNLSQDHIEELNSFIQKTVNEYLDKKGIDSSTGSHMNPDGFVVSYEL